MQWQIFLGLELNLQYSWWLVALCLLLGALYATFFYFKEHAFFSSNASKRRWWNAFMGVMRFATISTLAFLLLAPFLKQKTIKTEKPILVVAQDNSSSINQHFRIEDSATYHNNFNAILSELKEEFEVKTLQFGNEVTPLSNLNYTDKITNLSEVFNHVNSQYFNQNLGAVILATDGLFNQGSNPAYTNLQLDAPVYSIALGDTTLRRDLKVADVLHNRIAYLGDKLAARIELSGYNCNNEQSQVTVRKRLKMGGSKLLFSEKIKFNQNTYNQAFEVIMDADEVGVQSYSVHFAPIDNEVTNANNTKVFYVEVLDGRQEVLILANAPHPDLSALKTAINQNKNYEATVALAGKFKGNIEAFDLVVLHQLPSKKHAIQNLLSSAKQIKKPLLFIISNQNDLGAVNKAQPALKLTGFNGQVNEVTPTLSEGFQLFKLPENFDELEKFPPLLSPYAEYKPAANAKVLLNQKIGTVTTNYPLIVLHEDAGQKIGVMAGSGLWRWKLFDYQQNGNHNLINELLNKLVQYTSIKEDKRKFRAPVQKNLFLENEAITFSAELYNNSYELINNPDVSLVIKDANNSEFVFTFSKSTNAYYLNAGNLPPGEYSYTATTTFGGKNYNYSGKFSVSAIEIELLQTTANHALLYQLSNNTQGKVVYPQQMNNILTHIRQNNKIAATSYEDVTTKPLINLKWLLIVLLALLGLEWFSRKYLGGY